jgi:hypothetical protein
MRTASKADTAMDLVAIKAKVTTGVDCNLTLITPCVNGSYIPLKTGSNKDLIAAGGTLIGRFLVRARCVNTPGLQGIDVRAAALSTAGMANAGALLFEAKDTSWFRADEMNQNLPYSWSHPKSSLTAAAPGIPNLLCSAGAVGGTVPPGGIIMWSGSPATIPPGWALCDGGGGRPDLRDRFIMGAGAVQPSTGNGTLSLTAANLPSHSHAITNPINSAQVAIQAPRPGSWVSLGYPNPNAWGGGYQSLTYLSNAAATVTESSGTGAPITVIPPYYSLAFIIKLP